MKTLASLLCLILIVVPVGAQQIAQRPAPNFYVPYAVGLSRPAAMAGESSSADPGALELGYIPSAPPAQRYPMRRPYRRFGPRYMGYLSPPGPPISTRAALIIAGVVAGIIVAGVVKAHQ